MRRRTALISAATALTGGLLTFSGCGPVTDPAPDDTEDEPTSVNIPTAEDAMEAVGLPLPDAELTTSDGIVVSDLDEWSIRVTFSADTSTVEDWLAAAFGPGAEGLPISEDGMVISQRIAPEETEEGARYLKGSNPKNPRASYTVLLSPDGTDVLIALARTTR